MLKVVSQEISDYDLKYLVSTIKITFEKMHLTQFKFHVIYFMNHAQKQRNVSQVYQLIMV